MRIPLPTTLKTRTGAPSDKDARQKNSYVETRGEEAIVRKRPSAQGGIPIGTGIAQGGIGLYINGTPYFIGFWADTMQAYTGGGGNWDAGTSYSIGGEVWIVEDENGDQITTPPDDPFDKRYTAKKYYAQGPNTNKNPSSNPNYWGLTPPPATRFYAQGAEYVSGSNVTRTGASCATEMAAVQSCFDAFVYHSCPGNGSPYYTWYTAVTIISGAYPFRYGYFTAGYATGGDCDQAVYGDGAVAQLYQTA